MLFTMNLRKQKSDNINENGFERELAVRYSTQ